jgi:hypothetical protein
VVLRWFGRDHYLLLPGVREQIVHELFTVARPEANAFLVRTADAASAGAERQRKQACLGRASAQTL